MSPTATRSRAESGPASYQFGTGAATGVWLGFGASRVGVVGVGLLASILTLTVGVPVFLAAAPILLCLSVAVATVAGRPLLEWVAPVLGHRTATVTGTRGWRAPFPTAPTRPVSRGTRLRLPPEYGRLRVLDCADDPSIGLIVEASPRTVTVVFDVAGVDRFPLLEPEDRDTLIAGWGQTLAVLADTDPTLVRLQLLERATNEALAVDAGVEPSSDLASDYQGLSHTIEALATRHDSRLAVQWAIGRLDDTALATFASRCRSVSHSLLTARLLTRPLCATEITRDLATALRGPQLSDPPTPTPGPLSRRASWTEVRTDEVYHRSYAVTGWPSSPVTSEWMTPLLLSAPAGVTRTVAIHLERVSAAVAARTARTARAKAALDQRDRVRLGMSTSAALDRAESTGVAMDEELSAGYRTHRLTGLITVSADTTAALDDAARELRQAAAATRLELQPLHGQHDRALAASVPLCRARSRGQS